MAQNEALERKNEILKKKIGQMIMRENCGQSLNEQDSMLKDRWIRELHANHLSLK